MGKPSPSAGQMGRLGLVEEQEGGLLPARCSILGYQAWEGVGAWGSGVGTD